MCLPIPPRWCNGDPDRVRTYGLKIRNLTLYPAELRDLIESIIYLNKMSDNVPKTGDVVLLHERFRSHGATCIIINTHKSFQGGEGGWISFTYEAVTSTGQIINLTESCVERVIKQAKDEVIS